jgi:hypothetical protein
MEWCRLCSVIASGSRSVTIVCSADRGSTAGAATSLGLDGSDVMGVACGIASARGLSRTRFSDGVQTALTLPRGGAKINLPLPQTGPRRPRERGRSL